MFTSTPWLREHLHIAQIPGTGPVHSFRMIVVEISYDTRSSRRNLAHPVELILIRCTAFGSFSFKIVSY